MGAASNKCRRGAAALDRILPWDEAESFAHGHEVEGNGMEYFIGVDVSLKQSSVCVLDQHGNVVREAKVLSEPEELIAFVLEFPPKTTCVGFEAGPLSQWLHHHLTNAGIAVALMETRQVKAVLKATPIKTDRRAAMGLARLLRMGWFRPVHCKSISSQEVRALLSGRKAVLSAIVNLENAVRGVLRNFGLKVGQIGKIGFEARIRELAEGNPRLEAMVEGILRSRAALREEFADLDKRIRHLAAEDEVCRRMMTVPGVGAITALTFKAGIDDPSRFRSSKMVGPHFGLTPRRDQSGEKDVVGGITRAGDVGVRTALYGAASVMLRRSSKPSWLRAWGMRVARRRGLKRGIVAVARRLGVILHRMWMDGTEFQFTLERGSSAAA
jgi:transposase